MNYNKEHNIYPVKPLMSYAETDTVQINGKYTYEQIAKYLDMPAADVATLNPVFKTNGLPGTSNNQSLRLPKEKIGLFLANQDSIRFNSNLAVETEFFAQSKIPTVQRTSSITHSVKKGESLGKIANKYNVSVAQLKSWNKLRSNTVVKGQKLKIKREISVPENLAKAESKLDSLTSDSSKTQEEIASSAKPTDKKIIAKKPLTTNSNAVYIFHTVQPGDTLWSIANKYDGATIDKLKKLNKNVNTSKLKPGQKIKVQVT